MRKSSTDKLTNTENQFIWAGFLDCF